MINCTIFRSTKKQIAFILAHSQVYLELDEDSDGYDELMEIMSNSRLNANHLALARELDIAEPKTPEDVYKTHLEQHRRFSCYQLFFKSKWPVAVVII